MAITLHLALQRFEHMPANRLWPALTPDERREWSSRTEHSRWQLLGRAFRRAHLARALALAPDALLMTTTPLGKPLLPGQPVCFSSSHSRSAYALAWNTESVPIGIDAEDRNRHVRGAALARAYFSRAERRHWQRLGCDTVSWLKIWTRKEAMLKCCGLGMRVPLAALDTGAPDCAELTLPSPGGPLRVRSWEQCGQVISVALPARVGRLRIEDVGACAASST